jgi:hypothetical protein
LWLSEQFSFEILKDKDMKKPTIYEALKEKLGREPKHSELVNEVKRILKGE